MATHPPVGIIGLGLLGSVLAARLIGAGIPVTGFDVDSRQRAMLKDLGGEIAATATQVIVRCQTILVAIYNAGQIELLFDELGRRPHLAGAVMVCTTTCSPEDILSIAARAAEAGLGFVEAPISGTSAETRDGSALALIAGEPQAIDAVQWVLNVICPQQMRMGGIGNAARTKLALNLILQNNRAALAEGLAFAESMGLDAAAFLATARRSAAYSRVMDSKGDKMLARDFAPQSHIAQTLKDSELILEEARQQEQHLPMTLIQTGLLRSAITLVGPEADSSAVIEAIRRKPKPRGRR
ncbi:MAG TPA: NAD(P)-dependent oxidoreductase [Xanthobacteraceae bacterium]|nr:NAD(P)-dependent oxidoreductase [Xanthobacteraceae bacterium]